LRGFTRPPIVATVGAACRLGDMYREGLGGLRHSPKQTFRWYSRSAMAGDTERAEQPGRLLRARAGCAQSYPKAVKWYRLAAAQNLGTASMNLGYCHLRGHGVPADKGEALRLFRLAVEQGEEKAQQEVEQLESGPRVRIVDVTEPGRNLGLAGVEPSAPEDAGKRPWTDEDFHRASLGAWQKDDCFDLPEPGSAFDKLLREQGDRVIEKMIREGRIPPLRDKPAS
jgi:hypothetical protein